MNPGSPGSFLHQLCLTHGKSEASQHICPCPLTNENILISPHAAKLPTGGLKGQGYINEAVLFVF
jgi:hypothetical protein